MEKTREWSSEISFLKISELKYSGKDHNFNYGIINASPSFCNRIVDKMTENKSQERVQLSLSVFIYDRGSQLISMGGHRGPKTAQIYMSEGQMNTIIALCVSFYFKNDKGLTKNVWQAGFGPWAACWEPLIYGHDSKFEN